MSSRDLSEALKMEEICEIAAEASKSCQEGRGVLLFVHATQSNLEKLAWALSVRLGKILVYVVSGSARGQYSWEFSRLRLHPRLKLLFDGMVVTESGGLIFEQGRPIILLAEDFDLFEPKDQLSYSHLVDGESMSLSLGLFTGSILIAGLSSGGTTIATEVMGRGMHLTMAAT